jgi:hypothetical protein
MACKEVALVAETKSWMPSNPRNHCQQPSGLPSLFAPSTENLHSPLFVPSREQSADNVLRDKSVEWNGMEANELDWLMRGWTPEYIHRERVCRHPFGSVAPLRDDPSTRRL